MLTNFQILGRKGIKLNKKYILVVKKVFDKLIFRGYDEEVTLKDITRII